jgi:PleD family two-component response regulator
MNPSEDNKPFILIVDDNPTNLDVLIEILHQEYRLSVAKSGQKALEFVQKHIPDLILLDIVMPEMDGFEVCQALKSSDITKAIPVIIISSVSDADSITKIFKMGGEDYLSKPFIPIEVKTRIKNQLDLREFRKDL